MDLHGSAPQAGAGILPNPAPSVLRALNGVQERLAALRTGDDGTGLRAVARELLQALDLNGDVALACVLRSQVAGSYALRHSVETAVIAALVARRLHVRPAHLLALTVAALALHATGRHDDGRQASHAPRCAAAERDWFACLLLDHAPDPQPEGHDLDAAAHLLRMADRYCAAVSPRNYRRALLADDALRRVLADAPDDALAEAFAREIGAFPPGAVVRLASGETGVVTHRDGGGPEVLCLLDGTLNALPVPLPRRTDGAGSAIAAVLGEDDVELRFSMTQVWGTLAGL